jgi:hypothetical protein
MPLTLLLFPSSGSPADRLIAHFEGSATDAIHAAVLCGDYFVEAVSPLTRMMPAERLPANVRRVPLNLTAQQEAALVAYLRARVGQERYSVRQIAIDAIGLTTHHWLPAPTQGCDCSSLIAEGLASLGICPFAPKDPADITPQDLAVWADAGLPALLTGATTTTVTTVSTTTDPPLVAASGLA